MLRPANARRRALNPTTLKREIIVHPQRGVVRKTQALEDKGALGFVGQARGGQLVVNAPTHVLGIGLTALAPPGVGLVALLGIEVSVNIDLACGAQQLRQPGTLLRQKARVFQVALPVFEVNGVVGNVQVPHQDELPLFGQGQQMGVDDVQKGVFRGLALVSTRATGKVGADQAHALAFAVKAFFNPPPLCIKLGVAQAHQGLGGLGVGVQTDTRIAFFLGMVKVTRQGLALKVHRDFHVLAHVGFLGFEFLHTHAGARLGLQPVKKPFAVGRTHAVEVCRDDAHERDLWMGVVGLKSEAVNKGCQIWGQAQSPGKRRFV